MPSSQQNNKHASLIDLSEFDPFHSATPPRVASPHIFAAPAPAPRSTSSFTSPSFATSSNAIAVSSKTIIPTVESVGKGKDPLDLFSSLDLQDNSQSGTTNQGSTTTTTNRSNHVADNLRYHVKAQDQRQERIWSDLHRDPWSSPPSELSSTAGAMPITSNVALPIPPPKKSSAPAFSFSPPRRLSGLMNDTAPFPSSSNTYFNSIDQNGSIATSPISKPEIDMFHPSSPPLETIQSNHRLVRRLSIEQTSSASKSHSFSKNSRRIPSSSGYSDNDSEWGDFLSASPQARHASLPSPTSTTTTMTMKRSANGHHSNTMPTSSSPSTFIPTSDPAHFYDPKSPDAVQPIRLLGVRPGVQRALDEDIADGIRPSLPPRLRISTKWTLIYSLDQHGISIGTMYERMRIALRGVDGGVVLVVKDSHGSVFGAYVNEALKESKHYYGDGTCFLWKATPFPPSDIRLGSSIQSFKWTGKNDYLVLTEPTFISIGGGDGKFGLWIDAVFEKGFTTKCPCFDNEPLTDQKAWTEVRGNMESKFEVVQFECWGVGI